MSAEEFEPTPLPPGSVPLGSFYSDMLHRADSNIDLMIAAERFLVKSGVCVDEADADFEVRFHTEGSGGSPLSLEEVHDVCVTIPLRIAGDHMEQVLSFEELLAWYKIVVASIQERMQSVHSLKCLKSPTFAIHNACGYGRECPMIYTMKYLEKGLFETEFNDASYKQDPDKARRIAIVKEDIAVAHQLRTEADARLLVNSFNERFNARFHEE